EEHIRANVALFEPVETEFYDPMLDLAATILLRVGAFGAIEDMPPALRDWMAAGNEMVFSFSNPLKDAIERNKVAQFQGAMEMLAIGKMHDQTAGADVDVRTAMRDAIGGLGAPADWLRDREE